MANTELSSNQKLEDIEKLNRAYGAIADLEFKFCDPDKYYQEYEDVFEEVFKWQALRYHNSRLRGTNCGPSGCSC